MFFERKSGYLLDGRQLEDMDERTKRIRLVVLPERMKRKEEKRTMMQFEGKQKRARKTFSYCVPVRSMPDRK